MVPDIGIIPFQRDLQGFPSLKVVKTYEPHVEGLSEIAFGLLFRLHHFELLS
jgi:hypothetical protein